LQQLPFGKFCGADRSKLAKPSQQAISFMGLILHSGGAMEMWLLHLAMELQLIGTGQYFVLLYFSALPFFNSRWPLIGIPSHVRIGNWEN